MGKLKEKRKPLLCRRCGAEMKLERFYTAKFDFWYCSCGYWDSTKHR